MEHKPTHLDLFSGIGGFALAAQWAGFQTIAFSEIEPYANRILARHWPNIPNLGDIRAISDIKADLVTGGFPCQPYSVAGKRGGAGDDRALWPEMRRVIAESAPAWILAENVPGIINMELDRVLSDLEALGYTTGTLVIPACAVDARHRRDRVWIVAHASRVQPGREKQWTKRQRTGPCSESGSEAMAHAEGSGSRPGLCQIGPQRNGHQPPDSGEALAHSDSPGREERRRTLSMATQHSTIECGCENVSDAGRWSSEGTRGEFCGKPSTAWWLPEPGLGRVAHGIPNRAHRLKGLGNAIVPQVAYVLLKAMRNEHGKPH